ncbi:MAG: outer membrane beta-barrel protein, partial [Acidobacteria bacterium]|nr:outer membrane beta-barrel protein [Acidobacteriota bacterium]
SNGATLNFLLDGYYEFNWNRPVDRTNLLRPFDGSANSLSLNQAAVVLERAADVSQGRRFGMRLDLMFGQATESLAGNPANEPRTAPYRNIYQAYGTYIFPVGKGLTMDFGRFSSPIGMEGTLTKDQINYSRSLLFTAVPFYHTGFRSSYKLNDRATATWMLVNGLNQAEDFNGFKSNHFMLSTVPWKNVNWTVGYYVGREAASPRANGRTHIADTYLSWAATPKLTLAAEADSIVSRSYAFSQPVRLTGAAGYAKYQLTGAVSVAGRFEHVSDRGGFLSGVSQTLEEGTLTPAYQPVDGFQLRWELRHDHSNQEHFHSRNHQDTVLLGLLWWFGGKQGSW